MSKYEVRHLMKEGSMAQEVSVGTKLKSKWKFFSALWYRRHPDPLHTIPSAGIKPISGLAPASWPWSSHIYHVLFHWKPLITHGRFRAEWQRKGCSNTSKVLPTVGEVNTSLASVESYQQYPMQVSRWVRPVLLFTQYWRAKDLIFPCAFVMLHGVLISGAVTLQRKLPPTLLNAYPQIQNSRPG